MKKAIFLLISSVILIYLPASSQEKKEPLTRTMYICPMHSDVSQDKPGKCLKCGMDLETKKETTSDQYYCPMHKEVNAEKQGKCPKCGMDLVLKEPDKKPEPKKQ